MAKSMKADSRVAVVRGLEERGMESHYLMGIDFQFLQDKMSSGQWFHNNLNVL